MQANDTQPTPRLELLTTDDIARALGVTPAAVRRLFLLKRIPGRRVGRRYVCVKEAFERWVGGEQS